MDPSPIRGANSAEVALSHSSAYFKSTFFSRTSSNICEINFRARAFNVEHNAPSEESPADARVIISRRPDVSNGSAANLPKPDKFRQAVLKTWLKRISSFERLQ